MKMTMRDTLINKYGVDIHSNSENFAVTKAWDETQWRVSLQGNVKASNLYSGSQMVLGELDIQVLCAWFRVLYGAFLSLISLCCKGSLGLRPFCAWQARSWRR